MNKLTALGIKSDLCNWILNLFDQCVLIVRIHKISFPISLNTQGYFLSPSDVHAADLWLEKTQTITLSNLQTDNTAMVVLASWNAELEQKKCSGATCINVKKTKALVTQANEALWFCSTLLQHFKSRVLSFSWICEILNLLKVLRSRENSVVVCLLKNWINSLLRPSELCIHSLHRLK